MWHWTAEHPGIHQTVSSYYVEDGGALIDPLLPKEGLGVLGDRKAERVILSCRHHGRSTARIAAMTRARVHVPAAGVRHFHEADYNVVPYEPGDELTPSVTAHAMAAISPDDAVLHIAAGPGILHFADGLLERDGELSLMPDSLMDDPHVGAPRDAGPARRAAHAGVRRAHVRALRAHPRGRPRPAEGVRQDPATLRACTAPTHPTSPWR